MARRRSIFRRRAARRAAHRGKRCGCLSLPWPADCCSPRLRVASADPVGPEAVSRHLHRRMEGHHGRRLDARAEDVSARHLHLFVGELRRAACFAWRCPTRSAQTSTFSIVDGRVVPHAISRGIGRKRAAHRPQVRLATQARHRRRQGSARSISSCPTAPRTPMSLQIASMRNLATGALAEQVWLVDSDKLKEYELHPRRHRAASKPSSASSTP